MELYQHQKDALKLSPDKYLFCWDCGTGKSRSSIELVEQKSFDVLLIVPKGLVSNWRRELEKWSNQKTGYSIYTKEQFKKAQMEGTIRAHDAVLVDEIHFFAGMTSQFSKSLIKYLHQHDVRYVYGLTATPFLSQPWNVYRLAQVFGHKWNYRAFESKFFYNINMGGRMIPTLRPNMQDELARYVAQLGKPVRMDETADMPEVNFTEEYFELNKKQEKLMTEAYDPNPLTRFTREHQICGGTLKGDDFTNSVVIRVDKRQRVLDLAEEHDKLIVVCRYQLEVEALENTLSDAGHKVYSFTGDTEDRDGVLQSARKENKVVLIVTAGCSEGWEYPEVAVMVFYSYDFSLKNYIQMLGRIQRRNKLGKRTYLSLITKGTVDEEIFKCLLKKESFHAAIYNKKLTK